MARAKKIPLITDFSHIPAEALVPEEEQPYPVPDHWKWVRLGQVTEVVSGGTPKTTVPDYWDNGEIPWLTPADLSGYSERYISRGSKNITSKGVAHSSATLFPKGTVCLSTRAPIGYVAIAKNEMSTNQGFKSFIPGSLVMPEYLAIYLKGSKSLLESMASGTTFLELSKSKAGLIPFPLAPLEEQKQIVTYLDEKLGKIDSVSEKLQDFLNHADKRKDNLIQAGVTGHLVEKWREKNQDCSRTMFTNEELQQVSVPETWKWLPLGDVATILNGDRGKNYAGRSTWIDYGIPFVNAGTLQNSVLTEEGMNYISKETYSKLNGGKLRPGDILFCLRGSLGKCALNTSYQEGAIGSSIAIIRSGDSANPRFSFYYFLSPISQIMIDEFDNGSAQPNLSAKSLKRFKVPLPPLGEQEEIARILDEQLARIDAADSKVQEALDQLNLLKEQLVSAALAGRLTTVLK